VNLDLPEVAVAFADSATRTFRAAGDVDLARAAEADPAVRTTRVHAIVEQLGAGELRLGEDADSDLAAAELCRVAGQVALPYPLAGVLAGDEIPVAVVNPAAPRADHGDLADRWHVVTLSGASSWIGEPGAPRRSRLSPFVSELRMIGPDRGSYDPSGAVVLTCWTLLGTLERAVALTVGHVSQRHQFGAPLAQLQAVQFQLADAATAVHALRELARFTMWRWSLGGPNRIVDALALRTSALETATVVLRTCHQLHGAIGLCDEHDLSVLDRHAQSALRLPGGLETTTEHLMDAMERHGFSSLAEISAP
jgi:hypothetical protein